MATPTTGRITAPGTRPRRVVAAHERKQAWANANRRIDVLCQLAVAYRVRHVIPTIRALGKYEAITAMYRPGSMPNPAQTTIAREISLSDRQVRNLLAVLIRLRLIDRWSYKPVREPDGTFTRATNRYRLCDQRNRARVGQMCPLPRRHGRSTATQGPVPSTPAASGGSLPTGNAFPLMSPCRDKAPGGPVDEPPAEAFTGAAGDAVPLTDTPEDPVLPWEQAGVTRDEWLRSVRARRD